MNLYFMVACWVRGWSYVAVRVLPIEEIHGGGKEWNGGHVSLNHSSDVLFTWHDWIERRHSCLESISRATVA